MERAIAVSPAALRKAGRLGRWDRVYLGSSFCQALLPCGRDLEAALSAGAKAVTLLTPLLTGAALAGFVSELKGMLKAAPGLEVSVNDLGLMAAIRRRFGRKVPLSLGRPVSIDFIRMEKRELAHFMRENGFAWLESDEADMAAQLPAGFPFPAAFHYPLKYKAMSRLCPRTGKLNNECKRPCAGKAGKLSRVDGKGGLVLFENGYFVPNRPFAGGPVRRLVKTLVVP